MCRLFVHIISVLNDTTCIVIFLTNEKFQEKRDVYECIKYADLDETYENLC